MKKNIFLSLALFGSLLASAQQKNSLLDASFWKKNPDLTAIKAEIEKGNNPSESNDRAFDPVVMAIMNDAPTATIQFLVEQPGNSVQKSTHDNRIYLHWAASKGNPETVQYLINKGSDINLEDSHSSFPITAAASSGVQNTAIYEAFFKAGINPKKKYQDGANLLLLAITADKDLKLATYFATKGMSLKDTDSNGSTAFDYVARTGNIPFLKILLEKGVKYTPNALILAAQGSRRESNTLETYKYLVEDLKIKPTTTSKTGETVLHFLANKPNQTEIMNYFIEKGVDANKADTEGNTPLIVAASARESANVELLFPLTKKPNAQNLKGQSALTKAVEQGTPEVVSFLINKGLDINVADSDGNNLGFYLIHAYNNKPQMGRESAKQNPFDAKLKLLQEHHFYLENAQKDGNTLYHLAVVKNDLALLKKITNLNIDLNAQNKDGLTALHKAALIAKDDSILKYLLSLGAKNDLKTSFDETAYALAKENETLTKNNISVEFLK